jgi:hypothetical protein
LQGLIRVVDDGRRRSLGGSGSACSVAADPEEATVELDPGELAALARRWDALADELAGAASRLRGGPSSGLGEAAGEALLLLDAAVEAVARLHHDACGVVDGLLLTAALVRGADDRVAAALGSVEGGPGW